MRTLLQHIDTLEKKDRCTLATMLGFHDPKKATADEIASRMSSYVGVELIFSQCNPDEIAILKLLADNDVHYRDIEHILHIPIQHIEKTAQLLASKSIVYILKNRQLLSNKLDKICLYNQLRQILNPVDTHTLYKYCNEIITHIISHESYTPKKIPLSDNASNFLKLCIQRGCVVSVKYAIESLGIAKAHNVLHELTTNNCIRIFHILSGHFSGIIMVQPDFIHVKNDSKNMYVHNHFMALIAMLKAYDCITSKGLFLTQEGNLRKSDIDNITKALNTISIQTTGKPLTLAQITQLALYLLSITNSLSVTTTNVNATLKHLHKVLLHPQEITQMILQKAGKEENPLFPNPFPVNAESLKSVLRIIRKYTNKTADMYISLYFLESLPELFSDSQQIDDYYENARINVLTAINFLCVIGVIEIINNTILLSDIGKIIFQQDKKSSKMPEQSIYINPDFSLVIPYHEIPSDISYILLTFTDITSTDVTIHAKISKVAILNAIKRGMNPDIFISVLKEYAKNQLPQNIQFQLNEWIQHTPSVTIKSGIVLSSDKKEFIDELLHSLPKGAIVERINENHILISKSALDTVIKFTQKKDVVVTIRLDTE